MFSFIVFLLSSNIASFNIALKSPHKPEVNNRIFYSHIHKTSYNVTEVVELLLVVNPYKYDKKDKEKNNSGPSKDTKGNSGNSNTANSIPTNIKLSNVANSDGTPHKLDKSGVPNQSYKKGNGSHNRVRVKTSPTREIYTKTVYLRVNYVKIYTITIPLLSYLICSQTHFKITHVVGINKSTMHR